MINRSIFAVIGALALIGSAAADEFTISGTAEAGFNAQSIGSTNTLFGLTYNGSTFSNTTAGGFAAFGGDPIPAGNFNNFGSIALSGQSHNYNGNTFSLRLTFTGPTGISGGNTTTFTADVKGQVTSTAAGGVNINWINGFQAYSFANGTQTGTFELHLNSVAIAPAHVASITGYIEGSAQAVPEPATIAGLGIALVAVIRRRRA